MSSSKPKYQKLDQIEHVLKRPDMYVGSNKLKLSEEYIAEALESVEDSNKTYKIYKKNIKYPPALLRIFIEALSNALDNVERSKGSKTKCTKISIKINKDTGETSIWNDGNIIPVEINEETGMYNHTMIFGHLLSGSNFNDDEERLVSGKNGVGITCTNIFSRFFKVKGIDPENKKIFTQEWNGNMRNVEKPIIKSTKLVKGYTEVTYIPDFEKFGIEGYTDDIINLYTKYIVDAAMLSRINVFYNEQKIQVKNLSEYSKLYECKTDEKLYIKTTSSEMLLTPCDEFQAISFVNGVCTKQGGQHVESWCEAIFRPLLEKFNKKGKPSLNISNIKQYFRIFVVATVDKPIFSSQEKERLESPLIEVSVKPSQITSIMKWSVGEIIQDFIKSKEMIILKKSEKKTRGYTKIEGLDPANFAGTKRSSECSLILCEGLSAKTYAVAGIEKGISDTCGRNFFGILALKGKTLNCRNASPTMIANNTEITNIIKAVGLKHDVDYTIDENFKQLNYGKVILLADADVDGIHCTSLVMNFLHALFPTILKRKESFCISLHTPIVRIFKKPKDILFYDEKNFMDYASKQTSKFEKKYYKGLGTTKPEDVPDTFGVKIVEYKMDDKTDTNMNKVFNKKFANDRKVWLSEYNRDNYVSLDDGDAVMNMTISDFIDGQMIKFSLYDCERNIPNIMDGLKTSQRKVLYSLKKKNLKYSGKSLKVAQLAGFVAEKTNYHHGEQNLYDTIVKMANDYIGSNNIPLLYRDGMFSTRLNGKDAASARYIYTKMDVLTHLIFRQEDDVVLNYVLDDGDSVEPVFYVPIIPMILVNGCTAGLGTGWSCQIPNFNPLDIIQCVKIWLNNDKQIYIEKDGVLTSILPELKPWYKNFTGSIDLMSPNKYITKGIVTNGKKTDKVITELPIGMWTDKFKENLEDLLEQKQIKSMKNFSNQKIVNFVITPNENMEINLETLKLYSYLHTSNMVLFDDKSNLKKYDKLDDIIDTFCHTRYSFYEMRKKHIINELEHNLKFLSNKERFISEVMNKTLSIMNIPEEEIIRQLEVKKYDKIFKFKSLENNVNVDDDDEHNNKGYNYLLILQVRNFTKDKIKKLKQEIDSKEKELNTLKSISEKQMWLSELEELEREYKKTM